MRSPGKILLAVFLAVGVLTPLSASAFGFSFGGRVIKVIPCVSGLGPSLHVTIRPAGVFAPMYIWTPATFTGLFGPPRNIGQQVLGIADVPYVCVIPVTPLIILPGLRMQIVGTSLF